jgi:F-type H+-transporting ATPase subunit b
MTFPRQIAAAVLGCALIFGSAVIGATQQPAPEKQEQKRPEPAAAQPAGENQARENAQEPESNRKLAEESREAAGEEGTEFKQSAVVRGLAHATGMSPLTAYWVFTAANFVIITAVILMILRKKLPGWFSGRTQTIQASMKEAQRASAEAQARLADIEARLARMDQEVAALRASAEAEGTQEEQRIHAAAEEDKRKIIAAAETEIVALSRLAQRELKAYAAALAVELAEQRVQVDEETDRRLVRDFAGHFQSDGGR